MLGRSLVGIQIPFAAKGNFLTEDAGSSKSLPITGLC